MGRLRVKWKYGIVRTAAFAQHFAIWRWTEKRRQAAALQNGLAVFLGEQKRVAEIDAGDELKYTDGSLGKVSSRLIGTS